MFGFGFVFFFGFDLGFGVYYLGLGLCLGFWDGFVVKFGFVFWVDFGFCLS